MLPPIDLKLNMVKGHHLGKVAFEIGVTSKNKMAAILKLRQGSLVGALINQFMYWLILIPLDWAISLTSLTTTVNSLEAVDRPVGSTLN